VGRADPADLYQPAGHKGILHSSRGQQGVPCQASASSSLISGGPGESNTPVHFPLQCRRALRAQGIYLFHVPAFACRKGQAYEGHSERQPAVHKNTGPLAHASHRGERRGKGNYAFMPHGAPYGARQRPGPHLHAESPSFEIPAPVAQCAHPHVLCPSP